MKPENFWAAVRQTSDGCWLWQRGKTRAGYGVLRLPDNSRPLYAHRYAYETRRGPIAEGLHLDHLCRNRACVNPDHLEAVTPRVNVQRGLMGALKTHCAKGHEFTEANTHRTIRGHRKCRACWNERNKARPAAYRAVRRDIIPALAASRPEGICLFCDREVPEGRKRLCGSRECFKTYRSHHRREYQRLKALEVSRG